LSLSSPNIGRRIAARIGRAGHVASIGVKANAGRNLMPNPEGNRLL
jgi:hypothetical protein